MKEKLIDFGRFGKWSESTLKAQSSVDRTDYVYVPKSVTIELDDLNKSIGEIEEQKVKKMDIGFLTFQLQRLKILKEHLKSYNEMRNLIRRLHKKKK